MKNNIFDQARFDVADNGFVDKVMYQLPFVIPVVNKRSMWKMVFGRVATVVAACMIICAYLSYNFDYSKLGQGVMSRSSSAQQKAIKISDEILNSFIK